MKALIATGMLILGSLAADDMAQGQAFATVEVLPNGDVTVIDVRSDLAEDANPVIEDWLKRQAIELAAATDADVPNRTTVLIDYIIVDDDQGGRGLILKIAATGVGVPAELEPRKEARVPVRVHLSGDGRVEAVEPLGELPRGVDAAAVEETVRRDIESDPEIQRAAAEQRLTEDTYTMTVHVRSSSGENGN